jgi:hypothetical protein
VWTGGLVPLWTSPNLEEMLYNVLECNDKPDVSKCKAVTSGAERCDPRIMVYVHPRQFFNLHTCFRFAAPDGTSRDLRDLWHHANVSLALPHRCFLGVDLELWTLMYLQLWRCRAELCWIHHKWNRFAMPLIPNWWWLHFSASCGFLWL